MRGFLRCLFKFFEKTIVKLNRWKYIPGSELKLFYLVPHRYQGDSIEISEDTVIEQGDLVAELHIDNLKMVEVDNDLKQILPLFRKELEALARVVNKNERFKEIKAIHTTTVLYPIARREGFTVINLENGLKIYLLRFWENFLRIVFRKNKLGKKVNKFPVPKECWLLRKQLNKLSKGGDF